MYEDNSDGYITLEYCNGETLKKHATIVCQITIGGRYGYLPTHKSGGRLFDPEEIGKEDLPDLLAFRMYEQEVDIDPNGGTSKIRRQQKEAGFFGVWNIKEIKEARMSGLISSEQWDRLWPALKAAAEKYDTDPEFKGNVTDQLPPFDNMTMVDYLDKELNFPILPEMIQELEAKTARYANGTIKRTNIKSGEIGNIVKPFIDQAVKDLVNRKHPGRIYDTDIRREFDRVTKDKPIPSISNKEFYKWVGELGYQWVVDQDGKPQRYGGNRRVLSSMLSDGTHIKQGTDSESTQ